MTGWPAYDAYKSRLLSSLDGAVLEIGAGDGRNLGRLPRATSWTGLEPDPRQYARLARRVRDRGRAASALRAPAEAIPLADGSVDAVLAVVTLCSVAHPTAVLSEVCRVLRPGGRFAFAEHVAAPRGTWLRHGQRMLAPFSKMLDRGCDPARDTEDTIRASGLVLTELRHFGLPGPLGASLPYIVGVATAG